MTAANCDRSICGQITSDFQKSCQARESKRIKNISLKARGKSAACACSFAHFAHETVGAARTRSSVRPLTRGREFKSKPRAQSAARRPPHIQLSSSALCAIAHWGGRSSIPETPVIAPRSRGVLDPRLRGDDSRGSQRHCERSEAIHRRLVRKDRLLCGACHRAYRRRYRSRGTTACARTVAAARAVETVSLAMTNEGK